MDVIGADGELLVVDVVEQDGAEGDARKFGASWDNAGCMPVNGGPDCGLPSGLGENPCMPEWCPCKLRRDSK